MTEKIMAALYQLPYSRCELSVLQEISAAKTYAELVGLVSELEKRGVIAPVKSSGVNGQNPPLFMKYHIIQPKKDDSAVMREIKTLHYWILTDSFRKNPERYIKERDIIYPLSEFLKNDDGSLSAAMSENERAYEIWGNEKILDDDRLHAKNKPLLQRCGVWERLNTYPTPEPLFDYRINANPANLLIIENKDPWFTMRRLMMNDKVSCFFDTRIDSLIYGEGNKITRVNNPLGQYLDMDGITDCTVYYWGDLDPAGVGFFISVSLLNPHLNILPFQPAYEEMLRLFEKRLSLPHADGMYRRKKQQKIPTDPQAFYQYFSPPTAARMAELLDDGYYIPQEILNRQILKAVSREE